jgi:hypothetical protein
MWHLLIIPPTWKTEIQMTVGQGQPRQRRRKRRKKRRRKKKVRLPSQPRRCYDGTLFIISALWA